MTLELIISQPQAQITGNPECDNIQNVPCIQANIQFLNTIKGEPGNTPYIGENGNWWIGTTDTETKAAGKDGATPTIGENKHWFIDGVDTGIIAEGQDGYTPQKGVDYFDGLTPYIGINGNWWIGDDDQNIKAEGVDGISPTIGLNGNWYLGAVDTGVKAQGQDGHTPIKGVDYFDGYTPVKDVDYFDGITPTIGLNKHWFIGAIDTGIVAEGIDGEDGVTPIITIGENENWYINGVDSGKPSRGANGTGAYEIYHAGGGTLSEAEFNESITEIPSHIEDTDIHVTTTDKSNWDAKAELDEVLKLDQTTPQTLTSSPIIDDLLAGQMCYVDANKQLKPIDVFWDNVNKRFGVGKLPLSTLHVSVTSLEGTPAISSVTSAVFQRAGTLNSDNIISILAGSAANAMIYFGDKDSQSQGKIDYDNDNNSMRFSTFGSEKAVILSNGNVGFGLITPKSSIHSVGGIQCGDDKASASADKVGTTRYRETANASYVEMCVRTGASTFQWQTILTNTW